MNLLFTAAPRLRMIAIGIAVAIGVATGTAHANDPATAQALFDQARKLMTQERWAEACPKLEESQRLDPGGGTLLHLALCREHEGKTATAWAHYQDALSSAKRDGRKDRAKIAQARIDALGHRLPRMRIRVAPQNRRLSGFRVTRDQANVGEAQWNESFPVDPGAHTITAIADGSKPWTSRIEIPSAAGETTVEVPELEGPPAPTPPRETPKKTRIEEATRGDDQRTIGLVTGGVGALGVLVGGVFGVMSIAKQNEADRLCAPPDHRICDPAGKAAGDEGTTFGNVSTIAFIAGGVFAAAGAVLYLTAPEKAPKAGQPSGSTRPNAKTSVGLTPRVDARGGGLSVGASF